MQVVTIGSLLEAAIPCSSSSDFAPQCFDGQLVQSQPILARDVALAIRGTQRRESEGLEAAGDSSRKLKRSKHQTIAVVPHCWAIVGLLQLCNRSVHLWNGLYVPADCVALTDSTATICCCVLQGPDPRFVGQVVRVSSWSFIPRSEGSNPGHGLEIPPKSVSSGTSGARQPSRRSGNADCTAGFLEIRSLELLNERPSTPPSLFVAPALVGGKVLAESLIGKQKSNEKGLELSGLVRSISPPFHLPCIQRADHPNPIRSGEGSNAKPYKEVDCIGKLSRESLMGFIVELQLCPARGKESAKGGRQRQRQQEGRGKSARISVECCVSKAEDDATGSSECEHGSRSPKISRVFFSSSAAAWRPVLSGVLGLCVTLSGFTKKLILVGSERRPHVLYLATENCVVSLGHGGEGRPTATPAIKSRGRPLACSPPLEGRFEGAEAADVRERQDKRMKTRATVESTLEHFCGREREVGARPEAGHGARECVEGRRNGCVDGKVISFVGVVSDILFQGTLVELDERVWLLLTHQRHTRLHGLRIGATLSVTDAHAMIVRDHTGKSLLLGACMYTHISTARFSPLLTRSSMLVHSKSLLFKHIQFLTFVSTFWLLSLIGSFKQKFREFYSSKELLGGKKNPGIIQKYVQTMMAPDVTLERDVLKEVFDRRVCRLGDLYSSTPIKQVPPISSFCEHIEALWQSRGLCPEVTEYRNYQSGFREMWIETKDEPFSSRHGVHKQFIISGEQLHISLLGSLQVCQTSGQLQIMDSTGTVDVTIPDLYSTENLFRTYQVSCFTVMVEGPSHSVAGERIEASLISWSSLLKEVKAKSMRQVKLCVRFFMRDATHVRDLDWDKTFKHQANVCRPETHSIRSSARSNRWSKMISQLDCMMALLQSQTVEKIDVDNSGDNVDILSKFLGKGAKTDHLFKISCKVMKVKLLMFGWQGDPPTLDTERASWPSVNSLSSDQKTCSAIPLTLACYVLGSLALPGVQTILAILAIAFERYYLRGLDSRKLPETLWPLVSDLLSFAPEVLHWCSDYMLAQLMNNEAIDTQFIPRLELHPSDDGSGPADCWALGDVAVTLLGLVERGTRAILEKISSKLPETFGSQLSVPHILCRMVWRHGRIVLQNKSPPGESERSHYMICNDGQPLADYEQALLRAVASSACHNCPLVVVGGHVPATAKGQSAPGQIAAACSGPRVGRFQTYSSLDHSTAQFVAHRVEPLLCLTDLKSRSEHVAKLLGREMGSCN